MVNKDYPHVFKGRYVDMRPHDLSDDTWMLCRAGTRIPLVIGSREQILDEYDQTKQFGVIKSYK